MPSPTLTLLELNSLVRLTIERTLSREYWVEAELSECRESRGHCYMELIQKDEVSATPVARASAKCWRSQWAMLQPYFERTTGQQLHAGMKVRLKVYAQFHEAFGFSWIVTDIDPTFTLGDMARRRQEIIRQLKEEGIFDLQKELSLPLFCQRIAVISSETAAGYGDFVNQLNDNPLGLRFTTRLFPAVMQGEQVEPTIIAALNTIYGALTAPGAPLTAPGGSTPTAPGALPTVPGAPPLTAPAPPPTVPGGSTAGALAFDCVVIIRGGGATTDLSGFDTLALAENVAQFPIPIITGIGHDRDESILDMVSFQRVKTPTAAAAFLVSHLEAVLNAIDDAQAHIARHAQQKLTTAHLSLNTVESLIPRLFSVVKSRQEQRIDQLFSRLSAHAQQLLQRQQARISTTEERLPLLLERRFNAERHRLELFGEKLKSLDPQLLLRRGYSITTLGGKALRDPAALKSGDEIVTRLEKGTIVSKVKK